MDLRAFEEAGNILTGETGELVPRLKCYRFPSKIVAYAVWAYHRFALGTADVLDTLVQQRRNAKAARRFLAPLIARIE